MGLARGVLTAIISQKPSK